jgi:hypothetical protein
MNRNATGAVDIAIGPDNRIEPAQFDGRQPTHFPVVRYSAFGGRRERGVFAIRVPKGHKGDVVWTLRHTGVTYSVPGRATSDYYQLSYTPQAAGSMMPVVRFAADGPASAVSAGSPVTGSGVLINVEDIKSNRHNSRANGFCSSSSPIATTPPCPVACPHASGTAVAGPCFLGGGGTQLGPAAWLHCAAYQ